MAWIKCGKKLCFFIVIYAELSSQICDVEYHYSQIIYNNNCTNREYVCTNVTNKILMQYLGTFGKERSCVPESRSPTYCYTLSITKSQLPKLDEQTFVTHTSCPSNLYILILTNNNIQSLSENSFSTISKWNIYELRELKLNKNRLTAVENNMFIFLRKLQTLDLSFNEISSIGNVSYNFPLLEELNLSNNKIMHLKNDIFEKLTKLKSLDISYNDVASLDNRVFGNLKELEILYLNNNHITLLAEDIFQNLHHLEVLDLRSNHLQGIGQTMFQTTGKLVKLDLTDNKIFSLNKESFLDLTKLHNLSLMNNNIEEIPLGVFRDLMELQNLQLGTNTISELQTESFSNLAQLKYLNLSNNRLSKLPVGVFQNLTELLSLHLGTNTISELPIGSFSSLAQLKYLNLSNNKLSEFELEVLFPLHNLTTLDLDNNNLSHIYYMDLLLHFPHLEYVGIGRNNWTCSDLYDMLKEFKKHNVNYAVNFTRQYQDRNVDGVTCQKRKNATIYLNQLQLLTNFSEILSNITTKIDTLSNIENITLSLSKMLAMLKEISHDSTTLRNNLTVERTLDKLSEYETTTKDDIHYNFYSVSVIVTLLLLLFSVASLLVLKCIKYSHKKNNVKITQMGLMEDDL